MKKIYSFGRQYLFIVPLLLLIPVGAILYKIGYDYQIWDNLLFTVVAILVGLIIIFYPTISYLTGRLELEDGLLSRKYILMKVWSVGVSDLTDIYIGNTVRGPVMREVGLAFKDKNGKHFEAPYIIVGQENLIKDLQAINPDIQYHSNPAETQNWYGWKGDKSRKILWAILVLAIIGLALSKIIFR
ncbi:MAG: hypothetical protein HY918_05130 [Candidatus Doudnabacteria bacterium]|nr:hypothetical protein [Candidatus Doudnabacteria bacterium]